VLRYFRDGIDTDASLPGIQDTLIIDRDRAQDDAIGGQNYYLGRVEVEIPLGSGGRELGLRPSVFVDVGALWNVPRPELIDQPTTQVPLLDGNGQPVLDGNGNPILQTVPGFKEFFFGDSPSPRVSVGIGVSWNSPFGPFRFDLAQALKKVEGDDTQIFQFNVGTQF
jgi:outer membrane protein insertion porin family